MILFRVDANSNIGMGHVMRCLSIADAISATTSYPTIIKNKKDIKFVLAYETVAELIKSRGYESIILHTPYDRMEEELGVWESLIPSIDADLLIVDSYFVTAPYLTWLRDNIGTVAYLDDVLSFPYPVDLLVNYNAYASLPSYQALYQGREAPDFLLGVEYAPLRSSFVGVERREQREEIKDVLLSTGGSDELHTALNFLRHLQNQDGITYHILLGAMNTDKPAIHELAEKMDNIILHENVADMKSLICSMDLIISAAGSTLYEICACGVPLITYSVADNQVPGATAFSSLGFAINIGDLRDPNSIVEGAVMSGTLDNSAIDRIMAAVKSLAVDKKKRVEMSTKQQALIDGRGAERLADKLLKAIERNLLLIANPTS